MDIDIKLFRNLYNFKLFYRTISIIDFLPFVGSVKNAGEALIANSDADYKQARDKGITALVTGAIDLLGLSLAVCTIAYSCEKFNAINAFPLIKHTIVLAILVTVIAFVSGSKIVINQLVKLLIDNVVGVNTASAAVVNSVNITATGIETVVESVSQTTSGVVFGVKKSYSSAKTIVFAPILIVKAIIKFFVDFKHLITEKIYQFFTENILIFYNILIKILEIITTIVLLSIQLSIKVFNAIKIKFFN